MIDVKKLIGAAEWCKNNTSCAGCPVETDGELCQECCFEYTLAMRDHYEAELKETAETYERWAESDERVVLLRCDIQSLQQSVQTHKRVIEDYKARLAAERVAVIAEVREAINAPYSKTAYGVVNRVDRVLALLDSMEPREERA